MQLEESAPSQNKEDKQTTNEKREWLGVTIINDDEFIKDEVLETLNYYPGDMPVVIKFKGKYLKAGSARKCNGLVAELKNMVGENNFIFFEK